MNKVHLLFDFNRNYNVSVTETLKTVKDYSIKILELNLAYYKFNDLHSFKHMLSP